MWLHRRFASKGLINLLHAMGTCASYQEAVNFETSAVHLARPAIDHDAFEQWVFDNADVNIRTLDGLGPFHAMGGVLCVTPAAAVRTPTGIPRGKDIVPLTSMKELAAIPVVECRDDNILHAISLTNQKKSSCSLLKISS